MTKARMNSVRITYPGLRVLPNVKYNSDSQSLLRVAIPNNFFRDASTQDMFQIFCVIIIIIIIIKTEFSTITTIKNKLKNRLDILLIKKISFTKTVEPRINKIIYNRQQ